MVSQQDVTGATIFVSEERLSEIIHALSPDQRRYSKLLALATREPTEIWHAWESDPAQEGNWLMLRTYLLFFELSGTETASSCGFSVVRFLFNKRWELHEMSMQVGEKNSLIENMNQTIRKGDLIYSNAKFA